MSADAGSPPPEARPPFHLSGNFAPVAEEVTATDLPVQGAIPRALSGRYVRGGASTSYDFGAGRVPSEPAFVARSAAAGEDEGWVLAYVYDGPTGRSDLVVLDAASFGAKPVATISLPQRVPHGFHGSWIADP